MSENAQQTTENPVETANQRESAAAVLLRELDQRQDTVLNDLEELNTNIEDLIDVWRGKKDDEAEQAIDETDDDAQVAA